MPYVTKTIRDANGDPFDMVFWDDGSGDLRPAHRVTGDVDEPVPIQQRSSTALIEQCMDNVTITAGSTVHVEYTDVGDYKTYAAFAQHGQSASIELSVFHRTVDGSGATMSTIHRDSAAASFSVGLTGTVKGTVARVAVKNNGGSDYDFDASIKFWFS